MPDDLPEHYLGTIKWVRKKTKKHWFRNSLIISLIALGGFMIRGPLIAYLADIMEGPHTGQNTIYRRPTTTYQTKQSREPTIQKQERLSAVQPSSTSIEEEKARQNQPRELRSSREMKQSDMSPLELKLNDIDFTWPQRYYRDDIQLAGKNIVFRTELSWPESYVGYDGSELGYDPEERSYVEYLYKLVFTERCSREKPFFAVNMLIDTSNVGEEIFLDFPSDASDPLKSNPKVITLKNSGFELTFEPYAEILRIIHTIRVREEYVPSSHPGVSGGVREIAEIRGSVRLSDTGYGIRNIVIKKVE